MKKFKKYTLLSLLVFMLFGYINTPVASANSEEFMLDAEIVETHIIEDSEERFIKQEITEDGSIIETGIIMLPQISPFASKDGSWNTGTCYSNVRGLLVYRDYHGNRIQFRADVDLVDPKCGSGSRIIKGDQIALNKKLGGYFTTTTSTQYSAYHSGFSVTLYVGNGQLWTD